MSPDPRARSAPPIPSVTFEAYPRLVVPLGGAELALAAALCLVALLPFADRKGIGR